MKAAVCTKYGSPDVLKIEEMEKPVPKDDEVLIRVYGTVVGSTDPVFRMGKPFISRFFSGLTRPGNPVLGDALAGEIEAAGKDVTLYKKGDQIFGSIHMNTGAHAEYKCLSEKGALGIKPVNMSYTEAAAVCDGALIALPFLRDNGKIRSGQTVLINGASGSVGTYAVQLAKHFGAEVTAVCSTANMELVTSLGANMVIDYKKEDFTNTRRTFDIIFDVVGNYSFSRCKSSLKRTGIYITTLPTPAVLFQMMFTSKSKGKKAVFSAMGTRPANEKAKDLIYLKELIEAGKIKSVIDRSYPLEQIAEAHRYVEQGHKKGNVVIEVK
jgi:NADPH:quinone reductase-like Zn-dependent oxidoreductase